MSDPILSRIYTRRGKLEDPPVLRPGEFGLAETQNSSRVFIGTKAGNLEIPTEQAVELLRTQVDDSLGLVHQQLEHIINLSN